MSVPRSGTGEVDKMILDNDDIVMTAMTTKNKDNHKIMIIKNTKGGAKKHFDLLRHFGMALKTILARRRRALIKKEKKVAL